MKEELKLISAAASLIAGTLIAGEASAQMPDAIAAPGETKVVSLSGQGAQVYECKAGTNGKLVWTLREPIATLMLDGKTVGRHYAGPNWDYEDGSGVSAKPVGNAPGKTANDAPWLKLEVTAHRGSGTLADVTTVQRINTQGGVITGSCNRAGAFRSAPYSAEYVFLRKAS
jgi:hypothetical protein